MFSAIFYYFIVTLTIISRRLYCNWRASGIMDAVTRYWQDGVDTDMSMDPFVRIKIWIIWYFSLRTIIHLPKTQDQIWLQNRYDSRITIFCRIKTVLNLFLFQTVFLIQFLILKRFKFKASSPVVQHYENEKGNHDFFIFWKFSLRKT